LHRRALDRIEIGVSRRRLDFGILTYEGGDLFLPGIVVDDIIVVFGTSQKI
jgi:hypothetical protein